MCPDPTRRARAFALPAALFLLVVLWLLGAFIAGVSGLQQSGAALDVKGVQAYFAARAGVEWAAYQVLDPERTLNPASCDPVVMAACPGTGGVATLTGLGGSLAAYTVTVQCTLDPASASEGHREIRVYSVVATACNEPTAGACPGRAGLSVGVRRFAFRRAVAPRGWWLSG